MNRIQYFFFPIISLITSLYIYNRSGFSGWRDTGIEDISVILVPALLYTFARFKLTSFTNLKSYEFIMFLMGSILASSALFAYAGFIQNLVLVPSEYIYHLFSNPLMTIATGLIIINLLPRGVLIENKLILRSGAISWVFLFIGIFINLGIFYERIDYALYLNGFALFFASIIILFFILNRRTLTQNSQLVDGISKFSFTTFLISSLILLENNFEPDVAKHFIADVIALNFMLIVLCIFLIVKTESNFKLKHLAVFSLNLVLFGFSLQGVSPFHHLKIDF